MNKYEIIDVIDEGAYGIVWKALNKQTNSLVAIKEFKEGNEDQFTRKTIQRQIKMLKMLKSDFVVGLKEAFKKKGKIYLIFEYFQKNLLNLIEKHEQGLQPKLINTIIYKTVKCLQYLHSKNILHRDVKPQNILLNADYSILKMCDFGFARFLPERQYDLTEYVATRWYRSPELLVGEPYGKPADIWALGCIIGELVDGQPMFPGDDQIDQLYMIKKSLGDLTDKQLEYFKRNPKFASIQLPDVKRRQSIQTRYLGNIQKNALSFMKACLRMDAKQRITVQEALKHPYLLRHSIEDNQFNNDELNLLAQRKPPTKNQSKASLFSIKDEEDKISPQKLHLNKLPNNKGLKLLVGSLADKDLTLGNPVNQSIGQTTVLKKKSHTNLAGNRNQSQSPKLNQKQAKMNKMMSESKNLKVNVDLNLKINLKFNQKLSQKNNIRDQIESKLNLHDESKSKFFPQIKNNSKGMRHQLKIKNQKHNQAIGIIGESKQLIKGYKPNPHH